MEGFGRNEHARKTSLEKPYPTHKSTCQTDFCSSSHEVTRLIARLVVRSLRSVVRSLSSIAHSIAHSTAPSIDRSLAQSVARSVVRSAARLVTRSLERSIAARSVARSVAPPVPRSLARLLDRLPKSTMTILADELFRGGRARIPDYRNAVELFGGSSAISISTVSELRLVFRRNYDPSFLLFQGVCFLFVVLTSD